ncbi:hypothetical protein ACO0R3_003413 [Hanseniaspora guilliermondii]
MGLFNTGLPNFNQLIKDHNIKSSRQDLINILSKSTDDNTQKCFIDNFRKDSSNSVCEYIEKQIQYIETAVKNDISFYFYFIGPGKRGKKTKYGLPYYPLDRIKRHSTNNTMMFINVLHELNDLSSHNKELVLRDIFYKNVEIYDKKQQNFNFILEKFLGTLQVDRSLFNINAAQKGEYFCCDNLKILENDKLNILVKGKNLIPKSNGLDSLAEVAITDLETPLNLLIVEKDAVFSDIISNIDKMLLSKWLIITGRGQPDKATLDFVCKISRSNQIKAIYVLTDLDPYGIYIGLNYMNSVMNFTENHSYLKRERSMKYLGVRIFDMLFNGKNFLNNECVNKIFIPYLMKDYRIATNCVKKIIVNEHFDSSFSIKQLLKETQRQIFFGCKVEINSLNNGDVCSWLTTKFSSIE